MKLNVFCTVLLSSLLSVGKCIITFQAFATGTSFADCGNSGGDAIWGAKIEDQESFTFFDGENVDCTDINPINDGQQLFFQESRECGDQRESLSICLTAGDDDSGCSEDPNQMEGSQRCTVTECRTLETGLCFKRSCVAEFTLAFDVSNDDVRTEGVNFLIKRTGTCETEVPTLLPTRGPTRSPFVRVPTFSPSKAPQPVFPCAGTLEICGGGPNYVGPTCCTDGHECTQVNEDLRCRIVTQPPEVVEEEVDIKLYIAGGGGAMVLFCFIGSTIYFAFQNRKEEKKNLFEKKSTNLSKSTGTKKKSQILFVDQGGAFDDIVDAETAVAPITENPLAAVNPPSTIMNSRNKGDVNSDLMSF